MGKLNYFTDEFSVIRLRNYFDSLDIKELRYELKKFINQYLNLTEEQQFKYAEYILVICRRFEDQIDKETEKNILELLDRIFLQNNLKTDISQKYKYLELLYFYLFRVDEYEEYSVLFKDYSFFLNILDSIVEGKIENYMYSSIVSALISVFYRVFRMTSFPKKELEYLEKRLKKIINVIYLKVEFKTIDYWYFELDELVSIFKIEHLETISSYYINNPQSDYVGKYLDFVSRHFDDIIEDSIAVIRKIAKENNSDIIRDQAIKLIEKYDKDYLNEKSDLESISSLDPNQLLVQADKIIYYIRSKLTVDAKDLKTIGSFGHYTKIDTLTNFLIKADWKDDNKNENDSKVKPPYLRLTNLKQLNDPMEGRAIYDYLGIDSTFFHNYQTSNVFISSLTVVSDSLPMWKEYADSSQGAFLEYDMTYLEQIVAHQSIEFVKIHYLDLNSGAKDESDVGKALDNLKQIFEKMQEFEGKTPLSDLAEKLKKISYLFKVKDYEYEMEYRILINLDDTSVKKLIAKHNKSLDKNKDLLKGKDLLNENYLKKEEIGLETFDKVNYNDFRKYIVLSPKDNGRYALFVYINLAPLKYSKVILDPKVTDADYIAPYLKLANPDIEIESSKIPYR